MIAPRETYVPGIIPDDPQSLPQFLADELERIAASIPPFDPKPGLGLYQDCDDEPCNTAYNPFVNYTAGGVWDGADLSFIDQAAGTIEIPFSGLWRITAHVGGTTTATTQNEQVGLVIAADGTPLLLQSSDVASNSTDARAWAAAIALVLPAGTILTMGTQATFDQGILQVASVSFAVELIEVTG